MDQINVLKDTVQKAHADAVLMAKKKMPDIELSVLINLTMDVVSGNKKPEVAAKYLAEQYHAPVEEYVRVFVKIASEEGLNYLLSQAKNADVQKLAGTDFSADMMKASGKAAILVQKYYTNEIDGAKFVDGLFKSGLGDVGKQYADAIGIHVIDPAVLYKTIVTTSAMTIAYACASEAYRILMKALDDAGTQHERTLQIQEECRRSVAMIEQYHKEIEDIVSKYLTEHINSFEQGFNAMDQAILANDTDGYLKGNAEIQRALGHKIQFETKDEFDDMMASDIPLKL